MNTVAKANKHAKEKLIKMSRKKQVALYKNIYYSVIFKRNTHRDRERRNKSSNNYNNNNNDQDQQT